MSETTVLVTGALGFIGKNLGVLLRQTGRVNLVQCDADTPADVLDRGLREADVIFHLAGINRPKTEEEFFKGNTDFTAAICSRLEELKRAPVIVFSSSIQADLDNPYGISKRRAEEKLLRFSENTGARVAIFRLKNVFGKWCRPNYNSVTATFCHNIAHDLPITISDPAKSLELVYVDDVCAAMIRSAGLGAQAEAHAEAAGGKVLFPDVAPVFTTTLGALADTIRSFRGSRKSLQVPAFNNPFVHRLYATYLSYLEPADFAYGLELKTDDRGGLAEFLKSPPFGQIFVSHTKPGITRGNHYHHTKTEKFFVVQGKAVIRFRHILGDQVVEHHVDGRDYKVVDIPPGYTHSIENVGVEELVTLFWADEVFDPSRPDTFFEPVIKQPSGSH
jgi:UDP-2-acetamido-2,6-beta-L-arabino-hexul-4-ose reductase